jgi:glycosyltransferase involved in cell wall biosynthesis
VSEGVAEELAGATGLDRRDIRVIPNPVDLRRIAAAAAEPVTETDWFEPGAPPVVLGVGRLHPQKDFDKLLKAFALVRRDVRARLLVLGDGPARQQLETLARDRGLDDDASFPGFARNPYKYLARAAVFVLPSRFEGLPTVLIEALACGCPVVSTDCPHGPREILEDGRWGRLVPVGDVDAMAAAIGQALAAPRPADELKARAQLYGQERAVRQYFDLVTSLGNGR